MRDKPGLDSQVIFVASQPGVATSPVDQNRVLVYVTIANHGARGIRVHWDGPPPRYEIKAGGADPQSLSVLPGNSVTVAAARAVKVDYAPDVDGDVIGDRAEGCYAISWCCPTWPPPDVPRVEPLEPLEHVPLHHEPIG